jgi:glycosyltransferase involved in cell wall biosynthesis
MNKMNMAYLISRYPAISHTFILREIDMLRRLGFEIYTASINAVDRQPEQLTAQEQAEVANTFYVKPSGIWGVLKAHVKTIFTHPIWYAKGLKFALGLGKTDLHKILYAFFYFVEAVMVGQWMRSNKVNHLHVHFGRAGATVGLIAKHTFPIEFSMTIHGPDEFYNVDDNYLAQKILDAKFICCISNFARSQLMMLSQPSEWDKFEISPLGVDPEVFKLRDIVAPSDVFEILCVGRLVPVKGQFILLNAVRQLLAEGRRIKLRYIGDGPDRARLENMVADSQLNEHIIFEGAVNQDDILQFYQSADIFTIASFAEGVPVVLMEAMMMGIPCVTTHITGIPELIGQGEGLLVAPSDEEGLAEAIRKLMDDENLYKQIAQAGHDSVMARYELSKNTERLAAIFERHYFDAKHIHNNNNN